jgi:hypothetical protein
MVRVEPDDITDEERALMADALLDFRRVMPGKREVIQVPFRDLSGSLVTVQTDWAGWWAGR